MAQVILLPGDYVATEGMTEKQYHAVAQAFMNAGAKSGEYPNTRYAFEAGLECFGASYQVEPYLYHGDKKGSAFCDGRQLTIDQVLDATNAGNKETDMQNWKPEVGEPAQSLVGKCEVLAIDDERGKSAVRWTDGNLGVVNTRLLKPLMTEEDLAVEEMADVMRGTSVQITGAQQMEIASALYRTGYRKQPQPTEDMTDPANWRAGDWLECVADKIDLTVGRLYQVRQMLGDPVIDDDDDKDIARPAGYFRFHSRP